MGRQKVNITVPVDVPRDVEVAARQRAHEEGEPENFREYIPEFLLFQMKWDIDE